MVLAEVREINNRERKNSVLRKNQTDDLSDFSRRRVRGAGATLRAAVLPAHARPRVQARQRRQEAREQVPAAQAEELFRE